MTLMKHPMTIISLCAIGALAPVGAQAPAAVTVYEGYPVLTASELLRPEVVKGPYHTIMEAVPTQGFANQYTLQTNWGTMTVRGNTLLAKRIHELDAIARLEKASKSDEFKNSLAKAAATPFKVIGGALQDPAGAVKGIGAGAERFFGKVGEAFERGGKKSANTDNAMEGILGMSKAKREIAAHLDVDPYTSNPVLQARLEDMSRATFAGGFVIKAGTFALSAGAGSGLASVAGAASFTDEVSDMVRDHDPLSLSDLNRARLLKLGVSEAGASSFLEHPKITPSEQTMIVANLVRIGRVDGIADFLKMVETSRETADVEFFVQTVGMMADYHTKVSPLKRILNLSDLPAIHGTNNALVFPLAVDYGSWSEKADTLSQGLLAYNPQVEISERQLWISGRLTERARKELQARGFVVTDGTNIPLYQ